MPKTELALLISSIAWSSGISSTVARSGPAMKRAERAGLFGVLDRAQQAGADRLGELVVVDPVALAEALARLFGVASAWASVSRVTPSSQAAPSRAEMRELVGDLAAGLPGLRHARCLQGSWIFSGA